MKLKTTRQIKELILEKDPNSIIRCPNIRRFVKSNNIEHYAAEGIWLINFEEFMRAVNPSGIIENKKLPRMRNIKSSVDQWNADHKIQKIDKHIVEKCMVSERVFTRQHKRTWLINYDQLQTEIRAYIKAQKEQKSVIKKLLPKTEQ